MRRAGRGACLSFEQSKLRKSTVNDKTLVNSEEHYTAKQASRRARRAKQHTKLLERTGQNNLEHDRTEHQKQSWHF